MTEPLYLALRESSTFSVNNYKKGDILVIFGELFQKGYVNGLIEEAKNKSMTVIYSTVGRRDINGQLRTLTQEEINTQPKPLINIPLEAGFDLEKSVISGLSPVDHLNKCKIQNWSDFCLDWNDIDQSRIQGTNRFRKATQCFLKELSQFINQPDQNIIFVHTMAGGIPRSKIVLSLMNRVVKGCGSRFLSSEQLWKSNIGRLIDKSFYDVSAETYRILIEESQKLLQDQFLRLNCNVRYMAYGYHGCEILCNKGKDKKKESENEYKWQSYTPYMQGWAKTHLECISKEFWNKGIQTSVFNCPEILTNSSGIFVGVEIALYSFLRALKKESAFQIWNDFWINCAEKLKNGSQSLDQIFYLIDAYENHGAVKNNFSFELWPQHNSSDQMQIMLDTSREILAVHKDNSDSIAIILSSLIIKTVGQIMLNESWHPTAPVFWLGHDILAKNIVLSV